MIAAVLLPFIPWIQSLLPIAIVSVAAQSVVSSMWTPTAAMVSDGAEAGASGQAVGVASMNAAWAAGGAAGPVFAAWLADANGFAMPFALTGGLCAASAALVVAAYPHREEPRTETEMTSSNRG